MNWLLFLNLYGGVFALSHARLRMSQILSHLVCSRIAVGQTQIIPMIQVCTFFVDTVILLHHIKEQPQITSPLGLV